jgi:hypothetical protein
MWCLVACRQECSCNTNLGVARATAFNGPLLLQGQGIGREADSLSMLLNKVQTVVLLDKAITVAINFAPVRAAAREIDASFLSTKLSSSVLAILVLCAEAKYTLLQCWRLQWMGR